MQVIDIINKVAFKEQSNFKFWVWFNNTKADEKNAAHWEYKNGYVRQYDNPEGDSFLWFIDEGVYDYSDEIMIIEDKVEEEIKPLPPLEYIKFNFEQSVNDIYNTITYMSTTATTDHDTDLLALVINRLIREVEDLKHNMEVMDKSMKEEAENWNCRLQSIERNEGYGL